MTALDLFPNVVFLDVVANIGIHSLTAAQKGRQIVALEPSPSTITRLHKYVHTNGLQDRFILVKNEISDKRGTFTLFKQKKIVMALIQLF